jgi:uncharacterized protein (DUF2267 family)
MSIDFDKYASEGREFVKLVADELTVTQVKAGRIIRAVFHALRNWLSHEESFQLLAQLPVSLKGVYVDGWRFDKDNNRISHLANFLEEVKQEDNRLSGYDFGDKSNASVAVAVVFKTLNYIVSEDEMNGIINIIPDPLKAFLKENIDGKGAVL